MALLLCRISLRELEEWERVEVRGGKLLTMRLTGKPGFQNIVKSASCCCSRSGARHNIYHFAFLKIVQLDLDENPAVYRHNTKSSLNVINLKVTKFTMSGQLDTQFSDYL